MAIEHIVTTKREVYDNLINFKTSNELIIPPMNNGKYRPFQRKFKDYIEVKKITKGFKMTKTKDFKFDVLLRRKKTFD